MATLFWDDLEYCRLEESVNTEKLAPLQYMWRSFFNSGNSRASAPKTRTTGSNAKKAASGGGGESDPEPERQTQLNPMTVILDAVRLSEVTMTRPCPSTVLTLARIASLPVCGGAQ
ncbi:hypothetical protein [Chitinilyticum aquatile]|uniref:hypothetical protein n=1 Tax=Chitinilyticum aquatile TaxID=362520 RepID=UPI0012DC9420|nr:hypothetical protein [Chitinilyticum aquatile]